MIFSGHQPNFVPYMGFVYKMFQSDVFVLDDDVKFSRTERHNWNEVEINGKRHRITIPVKHINGMAINEAEICYERNWDRKLVKTLNHAYAKAPHGDEVVNWIAKTIERQERLLVDLNTTLIKEIAIKFELECKILIASMELKTEKKKNERNVWQCLQSGCNTYLSGIGGKVYNDEKMYMENGIEVIYSDYRKVNNNLSVLDYVAKNGWTLPTEWRRYER